MKLSILICSLEERKRKFDLLIKTFKEQIYQNVEYHVNESNKSKTERWVFENIEIIALTDRGQMFVGEKRNVLKSWAKGEYMCYFDDDDSPSNDYIREILKAIEGKPDVITFKAVHYENRRKVFDVDFGMHGHDHNDEKTAYRLPNHLCVWRMELAKRTQFPRTNFGEDGAWARKMNRYARRVHEIDKVLYHYYFSTRETRTQQFRNG